MAPIPGSPGSIWARSRLAPRWPSTWATWRRRRSYRDLFGRGKAWAEANLFNGEYYVQRIDLADRSIVEAFAKDESVLTGGTTLEAYWDEEHQEIKYQIGAGSSIDQLLGQWHASLYGLGEIFDPARVAAANAAIFKHNFIPEMGAVYNPCRIYCLNDEGGLVICAWPEGVHKPVIPAPYSQETMNGFEYAAAIHMIMTGLVEEGMTCVEAIRRRYDGERRNPWNEFECGSNYARSMAAYALLNAFAGFQFDLVHGHIGFAPVRMQEGHFRCFWSLGTGWGEVVFTPGKAEVKLLAGYLDVQSVALPLGSDQAVESVWLDEGRRLPSSRPGGACSSRLCNGLRLAVHCVWYGELEGCPKLIEKAQEECYTDDRSCTFLVALAGRVEVDLSVWPHTCTRGGCRCHRDLN